MTKELLLPALVLLPALLSGTSLMMKSPSAALRLCLTGTVMHAGLAALVIIRVFTGGMLFGANRWLMIDALSAYHLFVMTVVFCLGAAYSTVYFRDEIRRGVMTARDGRRYTALWFGSLASMTTVLVSNNLGIMWVGIEATTLATAFLICIHTTPQALEAMWKYLLMCSVGVALAFTGILLVAAAAEAAGMHAPMTERLLWTNLMGSAAQMNPLLLKAGFIFMVIGYGTKAGLAPMHNWLPDAHSQAPAPVSAIFSGFLLNAALYCILRMLPLTEIGTGIPGWGHGILIIFGLLSILVAAVFIVTQHDIKRLLAYSSVEHLGIITLGVGLGGIGTVAALFHTFNHSLCKTLAFFCAGQIGQHGGTHDLRQLKDSIRLNPIWGMGMAGSFIALVGTAPFALFLSELFILKAALDSHAYGSAALFLIGIGVVFVGTIRYVISLSWEPVATVLPVYRATHFDRSLVAIPLIVLMILCLYVPLPLWGALEKAAHILGGTS